MNISEKAAYIKGMMDGMEIDTSKGEGKVLAAIVDLLEDLSLSVLDLEDEQAYLGDYIEEVDEDLGEIEKTVWDIEDDYCDCDDCDCDCDDCDCDCDCYVEEFDCPICGEKIYLDDETDGEVIICPSCNAEIEIDCEEDCDEDGCCCCNHED